MQVRVFDHELQVAALAELRNALLQRHEGKFGSFWLAQGNGTRLAVLVNGDDACVHYFPSANHPGFYAVGDTAEWEVQVSFVADNFETMEIPRAMVVRSGAAIAATEEFFRSSTMPSWLNWEEL